jgi:two-component system NarL family sensor kinase
MPSDPVHRRIALRESLVLALAVAGAAVLSQAGDWQPLWLPLVLAATVPVVDALTFPLGDVRVSPAAMCFFLATFLCGPLPGVLVVVVMVAADVARTRTPLHAALTNAAGYALGVVAATAIVQGWDVQPGTLAYGLLVLLAALAIDLVAFANLAAAISSTGVPFLEIIRRSLLPTAPVETVLAFLTAGTVLLYDDLGGGVLVGVGGLLAVLGLMVRGVATSEERGREIVRVSAERDRLLQDALQAEERERRRVAAELHDDALQTLLAARSDIVEGLAGDDTALASAHHSVAETVRKLRELMTRMHGPDGAAVPVGEAVRELAQSVERRTGAVARLELEPDLASRTDGLVVAIARELLVNVAKHAQASSFEVRLRHDDGAGVLLEVLDDGVGMREVDRAGLLREGHLGLRLLEERVSARDGELDYRPRAGGGTHAVVRLAS